MKNLLVEMNHGIYPCRIFCAVNCSNDFLREKFEIDIEEKESTSTARTFNKYESGELIIVYQDADNMVAQIMAHEAAHVAIQIFNKIDEDIHFPAEPFCYLIEGLVWFQKQVKAYFLGDGSSLSEYTIVSCEDTTVNERNWYPVS